MTEQQPAEQGTHFWFMTVQTPAPYGGANVRTKWGDITPGPDDTCASMFRMLLDSIAPDGNVIAFDIQPNQL